MKKQVILFGLLGIILLTGIAAFGGFSNQHLKKNQNIYGGCGELRSMETSGLVLCPMFYDDTYIYESVQSDDTVNICAIDRQTGKRKSICDQVLCEHNTEECKIYQLCRDGNHDYMFMDGDIYYYRTTREKNVLYKLDEFTGESTEMYAFPAEMKVKDEDGNVFSIMNGIEFVKRMGENLIAVVAGNEVCLFDNDFRMLDQFTYQRGTFLIFAEENVYGWKKDIFRYSVREKKRYDNILEAAGCEEPLSTDVYFAEGDRLYVGIGNQICVLDITTNELRELVEFEPGSHFHRFLLYEDTIYYLKDGLYTYNLQTKENAKLIDGVNMTPTVIEDTLLIYEEDGVHLYGMDGKKLW